MKYSEQIVQDIEEGLKAGLSNKSVCDYVGITKQTFFKWRNTKDDFKERTNRLKYKKRYIGTLENILNLKIEMQNDSRGRNGKEREFHNYISEILYDLNDLLNLPKIINHSNEFVLSIGRVDIITYHEKDIYTLWEIKKPAESMKGNNEIYKASGIGQLLVYKTILKAQYELEDSQINMILVLDEDSRLALSTLIDNNIDIKILVANSNIIKLYDKGQDGGAT